MTEYIEKQTAIDALDKEYRYGCDIDRCGLATALDEIEVLPAADVVVPVRCEECKHWSRENYGYCFVHASYGMAPDDFCSYGERREG